MAYFVGLFAYAELDYRTYFEAFSFVRAFLCQAKINRFI